MTYPERENIDRWFFDFYEGNLSPQQVEALETFLEDHPDLVEDFHAWGESNFEADTSFSTEFDRIPQLLKKESRFKMAYALYGLALILSASPFIQRFTLNPSSENSTLPLAINSAAINAKSQTKTDKLKVIEAKQEENNETGSFGNLNRINSQKTSFTNQAEERIRINEANSLVEEITTNIISKENISDALVANTSSEESISLLTENKNELPVYLTNSEEIETRNIASTLPQLAQKTALLTDEADQSVLNENKEMANRETIKISLGSFKMRPIYRALSKISTGLAYIPDISYALPEMNQADVMISNIGAISQTRYQQSATARWMETNEQQKISNQITLDGYSRSARMGVGVQFNHHYFGNGALTQYDGALILSPKIALTRTLSLEPAARIKFGNYRVDGNKIPSYNNQFVEYQTGEQQLINFDTTASIGRNLLYRDLDAGITLNSSRGYVGVQAENITGHFNDIFSNQENDYQHAKMRVSGIAGTQFISQNQRLSFAPYVYSTWKAGTLSSFVGFSASIYGLKLGGSVGHLQQTAQIGYQSKHFGIIAQTSIQQRFTQARFTHQLMLRINTETSKKTRRYITL